MWPLTKQTSKNTANIPFASKCLRSENCHRNSTSAIGSAHLFRTFLLLFVFAASVAESKRQSVIVNNQKINYEFVSHVCRNFTIGIEQEFFSPNYPRNYPNLTECFKTITAPYGYVIRLEFREHFDVEPSNACEYDFLEVRDGAHGYAKLIGQFCGHTFPAEVTSSDRYLWLRFVSDDTIEYGGFRVAYRFMKSNAIDRPELRPCHFLLKGYEGIFGTADIPEERYNYSIDYQVPLNCLWEIEVLENWKIFLTISQYGLEQPNECDVNFIDIFTETLELRYRLAHFCGSVTENQWAKGNKLHILFYVDPRALKGKFTAFFTAFRDHKGEGCDKFSEYDCEDNTCIASTLRCNDRDNCKYKIDEVGCKDTSKSLMESKPVQIILIIGLALLLSILIPACWNCYRKFKEEGSGDDDDNEESRTRVAGGTGSAQGSVGGGPHTAESSLHGGHDFMSNSKGRGGGGSYVGNHDDDDDDTGCYVPEVDLSVFLQRSNGGGGGGGHHSLSQDGTPLSGQETPLDSTLPFDSADPLIATAPPPPLLPLVSHLLRSAAIGKEPHHNSAYDDATPLKSSTPPPAYGFRRPNHHQAVPPSNHLLDMPATPPPPPGGNNADAENNNSFPNQPFFPPPPTLEEVEASDAIFGLPPSSAPYSGRGINNNPRRFKAEAVIEMSQRPRSFESTKSAPDVIARV